VTVEELLEKQKIYFKPSGRDLLIRCLNPDHDDSNPSMRVDKTTGIFHCFSCGFKGNLFSRFNINRSKLQKTRDRVKAKVEKTAIETVGLMIPEKAIYFEQDYRNISAQTYIKFKAFTYEEEFPNRLVFPIFDITGKITCFTARSFDIYAKPKYKVHPPKAYVPIYPMTAKPLYGSMVIVEGIFDMMNLYDKGIKNVMCTFGTQTLNEDKLKLLQMLGIHTIHLFFDGDEAGQKAAEKLTPLMESMGFEVDNIVYDGADPGSLSQQQVERLKKLKWPEHS